jgi:hypothetical protein
MGVLWAAGSRITASMMNQYYGYSDATTTTVTAAAQTQLTTSYSIPANEVSVSSGYEIEFGGSFTWGSTQQLIAFTLVIGGVTVLNNHPGIAANAFAASAQGRFSGRARFNWSAAGASGAVFADLFVNLSEIANATGVPATINQANVEAVNSVAISDATSAASAAIDSTAAVTCIIKCGWASVTGAPTISNRRTQFKKVA